MTDIYLKVLYIVVDAKMSKFPSTVTLSANTFHITMIVKENVLLFKNRNSHEVGKKPIFQNI